MRFRRFVVYVYSLATARYEYMDEVYFTKDCDLSYVRNSLVNHDGYPTSIKVYEV
jgi:hypothetical protein